MFKTTTNHNIYTNTFMRCSSSLSSCGVPPLAKRFWTCWRERNNHEAEESRSLFWMRTDSTWEVRQRVKKYAEPATRGHVDSCNLTYENTESRWGRILKAQRKVSWRSTVREEISTWEVHTTWLEMMWQHQQTEEGHISFVDTCRRKVVKATISEVSAYLRNVQKLEDREKRYQDADFSLFVLCCCFSLPWNTESLRRKRWTRSREQKSNPKKVRDDRVSVPNPSPQISERTKEPTIAMTWRIPT